MAYLIWVSRIHNATATRNSCVVGGGGRQDGQGENGSDSYLETWLDYIPRSIVNHYVDVY